MLSFEADSRAVAASRHDFCFAYPHRDELSETETLILIRRLAIYCLAVATPLGALSFSAEPVSAAPRKHAGKKRLYAPLRAGHIPDKHSAILGRFREQKKPDIAELFKAVADAAADSSGMVGKKSEFSGHLTFATNRAWQVERQLSSDFKEKINNGGGQGSAEKMVEAANLTTTLWTESRRMVAGGERLFFPVESRKALRKCTSDARIGLQNALGEFSKEWSAPESPLVDKKMRNAFRRGIVAFAKAGLDPWKKKNLQHDVAILDKHSLRAVEMNEKAWTAAKTFTERGEVFAETVQLLGDLRSIDARYVELLQQRADKEMHGLVSEALVRADKFLKESKAAGYEHNEGYLRSLLPALGAICVAKDSPKRNLLALAIESTLTDLTGIQGTPNGKQIGGTHRLLVDIRRSLTEVEGHVPAAFARLVGTLETQVAHQLRAEHAAAVANVSVLTQDFLAAKPPIVRRDTGSDAYGKYYRPWTVDGVRLNESAVLSHVAPHLARYTALKGAIKRARLLAETVKEFGVDTVASLAQVQVEERSIGNYGLGFSLATWQAGAETARMEREILPCSKTDRQGRRTETRLWSDGKSAYVSETAYNVIFKAFNQDHYASATEMRGYIANAGVDQRYKDEILGALDKLEQGKKAMRIVAELERPATMSVIVPKKQKGFTHSVARILLEARGQALSREEIGRRLPVAARTMNDVDTFRLVLDIAMPKVKALIEKLATEQKSSERFVLKSLVGTTESTEPSVQPATLAYQLVGMPVPAVTGPELSLAGMMSLSPSAEK